MQMAGLFLWLASHALCREVDGAGDAVARQGISLISAPGAGCRDMKMVKGRPISLSSAIEKRIPWPVLDMPGTSV
jgi:hypothetical protein